MITYIGKWKIRYTERPSGNSRPVTNKWVQRQHYLKANSILRAIHTPLLVVHGSIYGWTKKQPYSLLVLKSSSFNLHFIKSCFFVMIIYLLPSSKHKTCTIRKKNCCHLNFSDAKQFSHALFLCTLLPPHTSLISMTFASLGTEILP